MTQLTARVGMASLWVATTRGSVNVLGLVSMVIMARLLVPADFGLVATAGTIYALVLTITDISMSQALIAHRNPTREHLNTAWTLGMLRALVIAAMLALAAPYLAGFFEEQRLTEVLWVFALSMILNGLANPRQFMLQKDLIFRQDFILQILAKLISLGVSIIIAYHYRSYWALVLGTVAGQIAALALSYCILPFLPRPSLKHLREMLGFSVWLTLCNMVDNLNWRFDTLLIGKFLGPATLGFYSMGNDLASFPVRETTRPLASTLFPAFAQMQDNRARLLSAYQRAQTLLFALALPIGFGMAMTGDLFVRILLGEKWMSAVIVVQIIAAVTALQSLQHPTESVAMAVGATRTLFFRSLGMLICRVPVIIFGIWWGGLIGLLYTRFVFGVAMIFVNCWIVRGLIGLGIREQLIGNVRPLASVMVMAGAVLLFRHSLAESLAAVPLLGAMSYFGTLFGLWRLRGMPPGAEREIADIAKQAIARMSSWLPA
jgi:O-antigen/teichoic acid export membrane protein